MNEISRSMAACWRSSIGRKILVALSGAFLVIFIAAHMTGNLLVYAGRSIFNEYAATLQGMGYGVGIWVFRMLMLVAVVVHVAASISLARDNRAARRPHSRQAVIQATPSSLLMLWSGLTVLVFLVYHLLHFTVHWPNEYGTAERYFETVAGDGGEIVRHDAWQMVVDGFSVWHVAAFYLIAMTMLCSHLAHGVQAMFQTLGLRSHKSAPALRKLSLGFAVAIWAGFVSIPVAVMAGWVG